MLYKYIQNMSKQVRDTLKSLFSSSVRADILALLLNNPDEKFYVREIATLLRKNPSGVKRELDNLEKMGILISKRVANLKYFQAEKKSPLFSELKSLIAKSLGIPGALKTLFKTSGAKLAFIYGPFTENEDAEPVNLFIVGSSSPAVESMRDIEDRFNKKISVLIMDENEFKNKKEISDADLEKLLSGNKIMLLGKL
jgi:predicted transcriptional regulator with HTH domain